jgi:arylsulfatase A-like enzyme
MQCTRRQALASFAGFAMAAARRPPNFVLITCDDLGYADIHPYGTGIDYTPNLSRMAKEGVRFTSFYATAVCTPSRAALMTGCYPKRVGLAMGSWHGVLMPGDWHGLNPSEITVARLLKGRGYSTKCIGKWHLGDQPEFLPTRHGFDSYLGIPYSNDMNPNQRMSPLMQHPHPPLPLLRDDKVEREITDQSDLTRIYTDEAVRFVEANKARPFFLYLPHSMVHNPLAASAEFRGKTGKGLYADSVAEIDWSVGRVLEALEPAGIAADTVVVFLSDNGGTPRGVNAPLRGNKGSVWEGGVRAPAVFWSPGRFPAGRVSDEVAGNIDILPTFAAMAGGAAPKDRKIDGQDLTALVTGARGARSKHEAYYHYLTNNLRAVRSGDWKLHSNGELYNLGDDIGESKNVAAANAAVVARLEQKLEAAREDMGDGDRAGKYSRAVGKAKGPLRFWIPRHAESGHPPQAPVHMVAGSPVE